MDTSIEELNIKEEQETQKAKEVVIEALGDEINSLIEKFRKEANEEKKEGDRASLIDTKTRVNVIEALMDKEKELGVPEGVFGLVVREAIEKSKNE